MCGIICWFSIEYQNNMYELVQRIRVLLNRGYDSVGVGYIDNNNQLILSKFVSEHKDWKQIIDRLDNDLNLLNTKINNLLMHTRWATHGGVTDINAHPHISLDQKVMLVHNGIIDNIDTLSLSLNITPLSNTDSSIIAELISLELQKNTNIERSVKTVINSLEGTWVLVILFSSAPNEMIIARNNTPLVLGKRSNGDIMMVSEKSAFIEDITKIYTLKNNDILHLRRDNNEITIKNICTNEPVVFTQIDINDSYFSIVASPSPYRFWTLSEINQQIVRLQDCIENRIKDKMINLNNLDPYVKNIKRIILFGCGTSYHANLVAREFIEHHYSHLLDKHEIDIFTYDASGFDCSKIRKLSMGNTLFIFSSQSGETIDLYHIICALKEKFRKKNVMYIGVINVPGSLITENVDYCIYIKAGKEHSVASTKSYTNMVISNILLLSYVLQEYEHSSEFLYKLVIKPLDTICSVIDTFIPIANNFINEQVINLLESLNITNMFVIGNKMDYYVAMEASLKLKEISYIHCEASLGGSLKHGPFALLCKDIIVILIITEPTEFSKLYNAYQEIKARNTRVIVLTTLSFKVQFGDPQIKIPLNSYSFLLANIVLQLLAYHLAVKRNINPDFPRNLAKVVTVQ
jgi:glucosamine--fructose-6-phosphate aminotransferase (isomerizing)